MNPESVFQLVPGTPCAGLGPRFHEWELDPLGVEKRAEAHGIFMFFGGVGLSLGPPVVGNDGLDLVSVLAGGKPRPLPRHRRAADRNLSPPSGGGAW